MSVHSRFSRGSTVTSLGRSGEPAPPETTAPIRSLGFAAFRLLGTPVDGKGSQSPPSLADRGAGHEVIRETLRIQEGHPPRSWWGRLIGTSPLSARSHSWFRGAVGEIAVGRILARLGPEWTVLHAVPVGAGTSDIDHVLIEPKQLTLKQSPADVTVVTDRHLLRWLQRRRPVLTDEQVARIAAAAVVPTTWHNIPVPPADPVALQARFAELRGSVRSARLRRELWRLGGIVAVLGLLLGAEPVRSVLEVF